MGKDGRVALYALTTSRSDYDDYVPYALRGISDVVSTVIVIHPKTLNSTARERLTSAGYTLCEAPTNTFDKSWYPSALTQANSRIPQRTIDELILTGDAWFGPLHPLSPILARMQDSKCDIWTMTVPPSERQQEFPQQGFISSAISWTWTAVRRPVFTSSTWANFWESTSLGRDHATQEHAFITSMQAGGFASQQAFPEEDFPSANPAYFTPQLLVDKGYPFFSTDILGTFPPHLDRQAIIGKRILPHIEATGYPPALLWQHLARTVPAKALNAAADLLTVLEQ